MADQDYKNHRRYVPLFHGVLALIILGSLIGSIVNLVRTGHDGLYSASLITALCVALVFLYFFTRVFALKAQDRAIRAEENLRHYVLTGTLLDARLDTRQIIGLRFAPDEEFVALAARAAEEGLSEDEIKRAVKNWRADEYRA